MKKTLLIGLLTCAILASVITGTLAVYSASIDELTGDVVAKSFVLTSEKSENFNQNFEIAPDETLTYTFTVQNFNGDIVTETPMRIDTIVTAPAMHGKKSIEKLIITVYRMVDGKEIDDIDLINRADFLTSDPDPSIKFTDTVLANEKKLITYKIVVLWNSDKEDIAFQGDDFGNNIRIQVTGTQITK